jgi:hypothetical protein
MIYFINFLITVVAMALYDYFIYRRLEYVQNYYFFLDKKFANICKELDNKIEEHKRETRRIA